MGPEAVLFRPARAADLGAVPLILSSGPEAFGYVFGRRGVSPEGFLRRAFVQGGGEFGHRNHVVGEFAGEVVAAGAGWSADATLGFTVAAAVQIIGHYGLAAPGVIWRGLATEGIIRPPGRDEFYIGHLGVVAAARGRGVGEALTRHLLELGRKRGFARAALDVAVTNPRAEALYRRLGFEQVAEYGSKLKSEFGFVPGNRRMMRNY